MANESPITSLMINPTMRAAECSSTCRANPPALTPLIARRTVLSDSIGAPRLLKALDTAIRSSSGTSGASSSAEPPPETSATINVFSPASAIMSSIRCVCSTTVCVGKLLARCRPTVVKIRSVEAACPSGTMTSPDSSMPCSWPTADSNPAAIAPLHFPNPTTMIFSKRPRSKVSPAIDNEFSHKPIESRTTCSAPAALTPSFQIFTAVDELTTSPCFLFICGATKIH